MKKNHVRHLYSRAAFGLLPNEFKDYAGMGRKEMVGNLMQSSQKVRDLKIPTPEIDAYLAKLPERKNPKVFKELVKTDFKKHLNYNQLWLQRMATAKEVLRERMTLFWANHFVVRSRNIVYTQRFHNTLRKHALGGFREFVIAISKEAAMLEYLNNQQNKKDSPNENFARELMELFTLGEGNYSEEDIKEAARAFTGWGHDYTGDFVFRKKRHDEGMKSFLGKNGDFKGEDIIGIILQQKECGQFICGKIYRHFVNENLKMEHVEEMASVFRKEYNIGDVMQHMFLADWFYTPENIGIKIKSPVDLLVGLMRVVPFKMEKIKQLIYIERVLGQVLFEPPNVAGWAEGRSWIDANTLMVRMKLPSIFYRNGSIAFDIKGEFEDDFETFNKKNNLSRRLPTVNDWHFFNDNYQGLSYNDLRFLLLGDSINESALGFIQSLEKSSKEDFCIQLMSLPEYQLS